MAQRALPGFRDFYPEQLAERAYIMSVWRQVMRRYAFLEYDGPPLESLDMYRKKSGDELVQILIEIPKKLNERQKELLREFAGTEDAQHLPQRKGFMEKLKEMLKGDE